MIADLKPYAEYKESGLPWVGDIPEHWASERAKWLFTKMDRPVREEDERVERETHALAIDDRPQRRATGVDLFAIVLEPRVIVGARQRHEPAGAVARQQDAGFLEQLARGGHVIRDRFVRRQRVELPGGVRDAVAPRVIALLIDRVDASTGKHVRAAHEHGPLVTADHEHLGPGGAVPQDDDGGGWTRVGGD